MLFLLGGPLFRIVSDVESDSYQYARLIDDTLKPTVIRGNFGTRGNFGQYHNKVCSYL